MKTSENKKKVYIGISALCIAAVCVACWGMKSMSEKLDEKISAIESEYYRLEKEIKDEQREDENTSALAESGQVEKEKANEETKSLPHIIEQNSESEEDLERTEKSHVVALDPGHQGEWVNMSDKEPDGPGSSTQKMKATVGTQGKYSGIAEYKLNLDISMALRKELEQRGYRVVMTRTDNDAAISNSERAIKAYEEGGEIYVRIHANGSDDSGISGALAMTPSADNPYISYLYEDSYRLSECVLNAYCESTGFQNSGIQYHDDMTGINWSKLPVTILEMGFMTNEHDDLNMTDPDFQPLMVEGIANGIDHYFEGQ